MMFASFINSFGLVRQTELSVIQKKVKKEIADLRSLLNTKILDEERTQELLNEVATFESRDDVKELLNKSGTLGTDFRATDTEWAAITSSAASISSMFQGLLLSYNAKLSEALTRENLSDIFYAKRAIYKLMNDENLKNEIKKDRTLLETFNQNLSNEARKYFSENASAKANEEKLNAVFAYKKIIGRYLYMMNFPKEEYHSNIFESMTQSIDRLQDYLTGSDGRYNDTRDYRNWYGILFGVSRNNKLEGALTLCDAIVTNYDNKNITLPGATTNGRLGAIVQGFWDAIKSFFKMIIKAPSEISTSEINAIALPLRQRSDSSSSSGSLGDGVYDPRNQTPASAPLLFSAPSAIRVCVIPAAKGNSAELNDLFKEIAQLNEVMNVSENETIRYNLRNNMIKLVEEYNENGSDETKSNLLISLAKVISAAPFCQAVVDKLKRIFEIEKALIAGRYKSNLPASVKKFYDTLSAYFIEKYSELQKTPEMDRSKLDATLHCYDLLMKDSVPEKTLGNYTASFMKGAFTRQGDFRKFVADFITERNEEKKQEQKNGARVTSAAFKDDQSRRNK